MSQLLILNRAQRQAFCFLNGDESIPEQAVTPKAIFQLQQMGLVAWDDGKSPELTDLARAKIADGTLRTNE